MSSAIRVIRICQQCGKEFEAKKTTSRTCSDSCAKKLYKTNKKAQKIEASNIETNAIKQKQIEDLKSREFLSVAEAARLLKFSRRTIYRLIANGEIKSNNISKRTTRISRTEIEKLFT